MVDLAQHTPTDLASSSILDARERVSGRVAYTIDIQVPGMLHAKLLRSSAAHARIVSIDTSKARAIPGVVAVVTGADLVARSDIEPYYGPVFRDQRVLAIDKVRYVGEPVVAVAAVDLDVAQEAIDAIDVEYEELPAVFTVEEALREDAPLVHEQPPQAGETFADIIVDTEAGTNICNHFRLRKGDVRQGFDEADHVFEDVFTSPPVQHVPMETHACIADVRDGRATVWASTQFPSVVRTQLADVLGMSQNRVRVIVATLGGGYGAKGYAKIEPLTAVLSLFAGRPVRLHLSREEEFVTITKHGVEIRMRTGVTSDGRIVARQSDCHFNTGAYADIGPRLIKNGGFGTAGPYHIPHVWVDSYAVYTNIAPAGAFRGYGISQAAWAYETQMDMIAEKLGLDPLEFRMRNLLVDQQRVMTGEEIHDAHFTELLGRAATSIGWDPADVPKRDGSKVRAKGFGCIIKGTVTPSTSTATVKLNEDGSLQVLSSSVEMGQGAETALCVLAAERLDLRLGQVSIARPDTDVTPYDQGTGSSRTSYSMGTAVMGAVDDVREQLCRLASEEFEISPEDLELVDGRVQVKGAPDRAVEFGELVRRSRSGNLLGSSTFRTEGGLDPETGQGIGSVHWHQGVGAAEVEVDLETGKVKILRFHAGVYAGRIINPVAAELQTEGNVAFGVGQALFEEMLFDNGQLQNGNLGDYMICSFEDMPDEVVSDVLEYLPANEIHGIGETALPPVMPAVGNAIYRATGVRIIDLPITPEKILRGLRALA